MKLTCALLLLALFVSACRGTMRDDAFHVGPWTFEEVQEREWRLVELEGRAILSEARPTIQFLPDGALQGQSGVNSCFGTWAVEGEAGISITSLGSTAKAGPPELMQQETRFLSTLALIDSWQVVGEMLELRRGRTALARFVPAST